MPRVSASASLKNGSRVLCITAHRTGLHSKRLTAVFWCRDADARDGSICWSAFIFVLQQTQFIESAPARWVCRAGSRTSVGAPGVPPKSRPLSGAPLSVTQQPCLYRPARNTPLTRTLTNVPVHTIKQPATIKLTVMAKGLCCTRTAGGQPFGGGFTVLSSCPRLQRGIWGPSSQTFGVSIITGHVARHQACVASPLQLHRAGMKGRGKTP